MKILVVYAHPVETSFVAALHEGVVRVLRTGGHDVDDCDLYREEFDPILSRQDRIEYHDIGLNQTRVAPYVKRLKAANALIFVHPVWNFGYPAILKGFFDRIFLPGVSFDISDAGDLTLTLRHIKKLASVCTYGGNRWQSMLAGDPPRRIMKRVIRAHIAAGGSCDYLACYDMNHTTLERRKSFLARVEQTFQGW
jgi:putative NADPH-quinone reductase